MAEAVTNTVLGGVVNWLLVFVCVSLIHDPAAAASVSVCLCTVHSLLRGYFVRRSFARKEAPRC